MLRASIQPSLSLVRAASVRNGSPSTFTPVHLGPADRLSRPTAVPSLKALSRANSSDMCAVRSPAPHVTTLACSSKPTAARSCWMKLGTCRRPFRCGCSGSYKSVRFAVWVTAGRVALTCESSPPRITTSETPLPLGVFAATCTTASKSSSFKSRHCASGQTT